MPVSIHDLIDHLDELLDPGAFDDYGPNGLQVPGRDEVDTRRHRRVSAASSCSSARVEQGADLVLVHHGLFWDGPPRPLDRAGQAPPAARCSSTTSALAAYHLPLDAPPRGRQQRAARRRRSAARARAVRPSTSGATIGVAGALRRRRHRAGRARRARARARPGREPLAFAAGPERVRTIGIVSGARRRLPRRRDRRGPRRVPHRRAARARRWPTRARPGIHFIAAGHYATETFGVRALGDLLGRALRRRATSSSTCRTRSERARLAQR